MKKTTKKTTKKARKCLAVAIVLGKKFTAEGETTKEAIANLRVGNAKGKAILSVTKDGKTRERVLQPIIASRLFNSSGLMREIQLKNISMIF